jgi:hypothetical protein
LAGNAYALPPAQEPDPTGVTIPYPGRLAADAGQPVADGAYDFTFALYDAETGGEPLWSEVQEDVAVQEGAFNVLLGSANGILVEILDGGERWLAVGILVEILDGGERWLAVGVRGPGESDFTALTPRQRLSAASPAAPASPAAGLTCPHDHWGETWQSDSGTGLTLDRTSGMILLNGVDLARDSGEGLYAYGALSGGPGVKGLSTFNDGVVGEAFTAGKSGVYGLNDDGYGVTGRSANGDGVQGLASAAGKSGVYGLNDNGYGVFGRSASGFGLGAAGGGDGSGTDLVGDLVLGGTRGEIFAFGGYLNMYSNGNVNIDLDNDNNGATKARS